MATVDQEQFQAIVHEAEAHARRSPAGYRRRVVALGLLGYGFLALLIVLSLGSVALLGWLTVASFQGGSSVGARIGLEVGIPLLIFVAVLIRSMWIRVGSPTGIPLERDRVPELFRALDQIRATLDGPRIHRVLLDGQLNAFITQVPRLGIFGWHRNYLVIGLPLLHALEPDEFRAVLAHEYGHLSGSHGKIGAWIYRVRATWSRIREKMAVKDGVGGRILGAFFEWYAPYFGAYSFVLARANEYEADAAAAEVAGAENQGAALVRLAVVGPLLDRDFWPDVFATAGKDPEPPEATLSLLAGRPELRETPEDGHVLLQRALERDTDLTDTHPCLRERLEALSLEPALPGPPARSAATAFLADALAELQNRLDAEWREKAQPYWLERHEEALAARARLGWLQSGEGPQTAGEKLEVANLLHDLEGRAAALPAYREVIEQDPSNLPARLVLSMHEIEDGDEEAGRTQLEAIMDEGHDGLMAAARILRDHHAARGEMETANRLHERLLEGQAIVDERHSLPVKPVYEPHDLSQGVVSAIFDILEGHAQVRAAHLVRRQPELSPEPVYLLLVTCWRSHEDPSEQLARDLAVVPLDILVVAAERPREMLLPFVEGVEDARIL